MPSDRDSEGPEGRRVPDFLRDGAEAGEERPSLRPEVPGDDEGVPFADFDEEDDRSGSLVRLLVKIGVAGIAVAVFVGVIWYAYIWGARQGGDEPLPVVKAESGAEKVRPEDPGGMEVPHQDKLVMNETGDGGGEETVENLLPPPENPETADGDAERAAAAENGAVRNDGANAGTTAEADGSNTGTTDANTADTSAGRTNGAAEEAGTDDMTDSGGSAGGDGGQTAQADMPETPPAPSESEGGGAAAESAPASESEPEAEASEPAAEAEDDGGTAATDGGDGVPADATTPRLAKGDIGIQLAAFRSEEAARQAWRQLQEGHPSLLGGQALSLQRVEIEGKGTFWRVRTGPFPNRTTAKDMCAQLKARDQACLVITQ